MKSSVTMALVFTLMLGTFLFADKGRRGRDKDRTDKVVEKEEGAEEKEEAEDVSVVSIRGTKPFKVTQADIVRLTGEGIAGSTTTIQITGKAKLEQKATIRELVNGMPLIGASKTEFDLQPTDKGPVTAVITVTFPNGGAPKVTTYKFDVE
jgi:hypothetical protein